jgi:hypothetical protein
MVSSKIDNKIETTFKITEKIDVLNEYLKQKLFHKDKNKK